MRRTIWQFLLQISFLSMTLYGALAPSDAAAGTIFESGTLGPTGVVYTDLGGIVPGTNVNSSVFAGVRFELTQKVDVTHVGGHFVEETSGTFFGAIVALHDANDFPDSADLSTSDVLGTTSLVFPNPSAEVFGSLMVSLDPGWYALVFGSGLFGTTGSGGSVRNGVNIGNPSYIALQPLSAFGWVNRTVTPDFRLVVFGEVVPEPATCALLLLAILPSITTRNRLQQRSQANLLPR